MKYIPTPHPNLKLHPNGTYYFIKGRIEESLKTKDETEALERKALKDAEDAIAGGMARRLGVNALLDKYLEEKRLQCSGKMPKMKPIRINTLIEIESLIRVHLRPHFGQKRLIQWNSIEWHKLIQKSTTPSDCKNLRKVANGFLKWCKQKGYLLALPDVSEIPYHVRRKRKNLKPEHLVLIFSEARGALLVFLTLAIYNALRRKEIMTLSWPMIDLDRGFLMIDPTHNKLNRERSIPINSTVIDVLKNWKAEQLKNGIRSKWVFPHKSDPKKFADLGGLMGSWLRCLLRCRLAHTVLKKSANRRRPYRIVPEFTWHDLRATAEKWALKNKEFSDIQREKFADSSTKVQKEIYAQMDHEDLKGLENVVNIPALNKIIAENLRERAK